MPKRSSLLTELVGTFIFFTVIALSGTAGAFAPLAIGGGLMVMVFMGGHVSGAHYNPAVSFAVFLRRKINFRTLLSYWVVQLAAGALAFGFGYLVSGHVAGIHPGKGVHAASALAVEIVFTAALAMVVLNVAATRATAGNSYYGLAIGFTIVVAAFVAGPISGGAFNPALGIDSALVARLVGGGTGGDVWLYVVGPMVGAVIGAGVHYLQEDGVEPLTNQQVTEFAPAAAQPTRG